MPTIPSRALLFVNLMALALLGCGAPGGGDPNKASSLNGIWKGSCFAEGDGTYWRTVVNITVDAKRNGDASFSQYVYSNVACTQQLNAQNIASNAFYVNASDALPDGTPTITLVNKASGSRERDSVKLAGPQLTLTQVGDGSLGQSSSGAPQVFHR